MIAIHTSKVGPAFATAKPKSQRIGRSLVSWFHQEPSFEYITAMDSSDRQAPSTEPVDNPVEKMAVAQINSCKTNVY